MSDKDKSKKHLLWMIGFVVCVFTACLIFFLNQRETEMAEVVEPAKPEGKSDWVWVDIEDTLPDGAVYEGEASRVLIHPDADPKSIWVVEEEVEEETEVDPEEAERLTNWKANFPYKPTTDPDVVITQEMLEDGDPTVEYNHMFLRSFFESEARFTAQFEQLHGILEEYGRGDNPVAAGSIFDSLRQYHRHLQKDHEGQSSTYSYGLERYRTNAEVAEMFKEAIVYCLHAERMWPDREFMPEDEAIALRDRIVNEIQGMDKMPDPGFSSSNGYREELEEGFSPLVISPGWQAAYDEWSHRMRNPEVGVGEDNVLLANGNPFVYDEKEHTAALVTPDGIEVPLHLDDNGNVIIPTPSEIEEMIENGEGRYVEIPAENANQPPRRITEEEWQMQEAQRMLEEAARQQE